MTMTKVIQFSQFCRWSDDPAWARGFGLQQNRYICRFSGVVCIDFITVARSWMFSRQTKDSHNFECSRCFPSSVVGWTKASSVPKQLPTIWRLNKVPDNIGRRREIQLSASHIYHGNLLTVPIDKIDGHVLWNHFRIMMGRSLLLQRPSFFLWFPRARVSSSCVGFLRGNLFGCILSFGIYEACIRDALRRKKVKEVSIMRMHAMAWGRVLNWRWHTAHPYFGNVDKCLHFQQTLVYEIFETL